MRECDWHRAFRVAQHRDRNCVSLTYIGRTRRARRIGVTVSFDNGAHGRHTRENYYRLTERPPPPSPPSAGGPRSPPPSLTTHRSPRPAVPRLTSRRLAASFRVATWRHLPTARARPTSSHRELTLLRRRRSTLPLGACPPVPSIMNRGGENFVALVGATCHEGENDRKVRTDTFLLSRHFAPLHVIEWISRDLAPLVAGLSYYEPLFVLRLNNVLSIITAIIMLEI